MPHKKILNQSTRSLADKKLMQERVTLVRLSERTAHQEKRLAELDEYVHTLPALSGPGMAESPEEKEFQRLMTELMKDFPDGIPQRSQ